MRHSPRAWIGIVAGAGLVCLAAAPPAADEPPRLTFRSGSTTKLEQLVGEVDKQRRAPTASRTVSRYGLEGTDLGYSFEHQGRAYFLFGDTVGQIGRALDSIATTDARDPAGGVRLDFLTAPFVAGRRGIGRAGRGRRPSAREPAAGTTPYLTIQPPGISMAAFEVPVSGISLDGSMYVVVSTDHSADRSTDRSVLTKFTPPSTFQPLRTISRLPAGHFVKMSLHLQPSPVAGLPPGGPFVFVWGTGRYRSSDAYLSIVPAARFESGDGTRYFAGLDAARQPIWSAREEDAAPVIRNGTMGDLSVTWCADLGVWLMTYDSRPRANPPDGLAGPVIGQGRRDPESVRGGAYAPYVVERWTSVQGSDLRIFYVLSTWNPYVVVLMRSSFTVDRHGS